MDNEAQVYTLRAKADSDDALTIEIVQSVCPYMEKLNAEYYLVLVQLFGK